MFTTVVPLASNLLGWTSWTKLCNKAQKEIRLEVSKAAAKGGFFIDSRYILDELTGNPFSPESYSLSYSFEITNTILNLPSIMIFKLSSFLALAFALFSLHVVTGLQIPGRDVKQLNRRDSNADSVPYQYFTDSVNGTL